MKAAYFRLRNIMGISEWEIRPGVLNLIEGENATGKTTLLEGMKALFTKKHDATLLNEGAKKGELLLLFDDGSSLERTITAGESKTVYRDQKRAKSEPTEKFLKALHDAVTLNPISIIRMEEEELREKLLDILPLKLDAAKLQKAVECAGVRVQPDKLIGNPVKDIQALRDFIYDERTGVNRVCKERRATVSQLQGSLPPSIDAEPENLAALQASECALDNRKMEERHALEKKYAEAKEAIEDKYRPEREDLVARIAKGQALIAENARAGNTRRIIAQSETEADKLENDSQNLSKALENLAELRLGLLADCPIQGLKFGDEGTVSLDGVRWPRVNTARRMAFGLEVGVQRAKDAPVKMICLDGAEALDKNSFGSLEEGVRQLEEKGYQFFITRVLWEGELRVETK